MLRIGKVTKISLLVSAIFLMFLVTPVSAQVVNWRIDTNVGPGCILNQGGRDVEIQLNSPVVKPGGTAFLICCMEKTQSLWEPKPNITAISCADIINNKANYINIPVGAINAVGILPPQVITNSADVICEKDTDGLKLSQEYKDCMNCINSDQANGGKAESVGNIWTASGCVRATEEGLANTLMRIIYGIAIVFILIRIIIAGYLIQFGSNPDQIKENKQAIINAIIALIVGTGGIVIARFIGYDVLGIGAILPGLPKVI